MQLGTLADAAARFIIPVYALDDRRQLTTIGSALLMRIVTGPFLAITAGHVLDDLRARPSFTWGGSTQGFVELRGDAFTTEPQHPRRAADILDLAAIRLTQASIAGLFEAGFRFAPDVMVSEVYPSDAVLAFAGYPATANKFKADLTTRPPHVRTIPKAVAFAYAQLGGAKEYERSRTTVSTHIVARFDHQRAKASGTKSGVFPHPKGMSGGPVLCFDRKPLIAAGVARLTIIGNKR